MRQPPPSFISSFIWFGLFAAGIYWGFDLLRSTDRTIYWCGFAVLCLSSLCAMRSAVALSTSSRHAAHQLDLDTRSKRPSRIFGHARLAKFGDRVFARLFKRSGFFLGVMEGRPLFYDPFARGESHIITIGGARTGKTTGMVQPALLHWFGGLLVTSDIKGENAAVTADHRRAKGSRVLIWNPFNVLRLEGIRINPLSILAREVSMNAGKNLHAYAQLIAQVLIPDVANEREPFFRKGGRRFLVALLLYIAVIDKPRCHLPGLRQLVWADDESKRHIAYTLANCEAYGGLLREYGQHLHDLLKPEYVKTFGAMRDHAIDATMLFESETDFGRSLMENDFTFEELLNEKTTLFLIVPENKMDTYGKTKGLIIALLFELIGNLEKPLKAMFLLEEMGNIGVLPNIGKALSLLPQKGVRVWLVLQSFLQLVLLYGKEKADFILSQCSVRQEIGVRTLEDAKFWSVRTGKKTVKTYNLVHDPNDPFTPWKPSVAEAERPVLTEDEVLRLPENEQLIAISGQPVVKAFVVPFYQVNPWRRAAAINPYHRGGYPKDKPVILNLENAP